MGLEAPGTSFPIPPPLLILGTLIFLSGPPNAQPSVTIATSHGAAGSQRANHAITTSVRKTRTPTNIIQTGASYVQPEFNCCSRVVQKAVPLSKAPYSPNICSPCAVHGRSLLCVSCTRWVKSRVWKDAAALAQAPTAPTAPTALTAGLRLGALKTDTTFLELQHLF
ncbi:unnamed protein product [Pleuronectes platessa]|uniref:Uncharacterized protein n=1 Tax=Pleuronectes platessa TaxID=8262 RepID=A0A9N7YZT4_PLEPL|nr:unnamed protein product [Pleuronectes platessa]